MLLALGGAPDYKLVYWNWDKIRPVATVTATNPAGAAMTQCSFNPDDEFQVCVTGNGVFKLFKIVDNIFKPITMQIGKRDPQVCIADYDRS